MSSIAALGERIRMVRLAANIGQTDLAHDLGFKSNGLVSKIENGRITADEPQLATIATSLDCTTEFLRQPVPDVIATRPWLRAYADASARTIESVAADNLLAHEMTDNLHFRRVPDGIPAFLGDLHDDQAIEIFALEVRAAAGVAEGDRVGNAMRAADRLGCVVLPLNDELGRHLGMSQRLDGTPYIRVSRARPNVPGDRQRFTVLHEVGHLALHPELAPPETAADARLIEKQAHLFAAAFIAPADPLLEHWHQLGGRVTLSVLLELKAHWGMAVKALVFRFQQLGVIDGHQATALYKQISKRGWNTGEPVPVTNEEPVWFQRALAERFGARAVDDATFGLASAQHGLGASHLRRWTTWSTPESDPAQGQLVQFPADRSGNGSDTASGSGPASVTTIRPRRG